MYFDKVGSAHTRLKQKNKKSSPQFDRSDTCFEVSAYRRFAVDDLKEKTVTVYDYYDPESRVTKVYDFRAGKSVCDDWTDDSIPC